MTIAAYQQGNLDGLCGLYAIINGANLAGAKLTKKDAQKIFNHMLSVSEHNWGLAKIVSGGTSRKQLIQLLYAANCILIEQKGFFLSARSPFKNNLVSLEDVWTELFRCARADEVPLIGTTDKPDHWSIVKKVTRSQLKLFDSDKRCQLNLAQCVTPKAPKKERSDKCVLKPKEIFLLTLLKAA